MSRSEREAPYFAYGSNLYPARLAGRVPSARLLTTGFCLGRRLAWHKVGRDGSGKCDAPIADPASGLDAAGAAPVSRSAIATRGLSAAGSATTALHSADGVACVYGAVYMLSRADFSRLDVVEGRGAGYERATLEVETATGRLEVSTYVARRGHIDAALRPFHWYKRLVLEGARFHGFPTGYVEQIAATASITDPCPERAAANLSVLDRHR